MPWASVSFLYQEGAGVSRDRHPTPPPSGRRLLDFAYLGCWDIHRALRGRPEQVEAEKREGIGTGHSPQVWSGQARPEERGRETGHREGPAHGSFPAAQPAPVRYPVGPRKRGLACHQTELVTHLSLPTLDRRTAEQLSAG